MAGFRAGEDPEPDDTESNNAHAPGKHCARCGRLIEANQTARRTGDTDWMHELCPVTAD
jgi:hypothetical protein